MIKNIFFTVVMITTMLRYVVFNEAEIGTKEMLDNILIVFSIVFFIIMRWESSSKSQ